VFTDRERIGFVIGLLVIVNGCASTSPTPAPAAPAPTPARTARDSVSPAAGGLPPLADIPFYRSDIFGSLIDPGPGPLGPPELAWQAGFETSMVWPLLVDGLLIVGRADGAVVELDARTGVQRSEFAPEAGIVQSIGAADGVAYFDGPQTVYARDIATGAKRWEAAVDTPLRGVVADGVVYVASLGGAVGLSATTGERVWEWTGPKDLRSSAIRVAEGVAFISAGDGHIYAIDTATGEERWPAVQSTSLNPGGVAIVGDTLYAGAVQAEALEPVGELYAIDRASGTVRWRFQPPNRSQISGGAIRDGVLFAGSGEDGMYALRAETGMVLWHIDAPASYFAPVLVDDRLYVQRGDGSIGAYGTSGALLWETAALDSLARGPLISGGMIFSENDARVMAFADPSLIALLPKASQAAPPSPTTTLAAPGDPFTIRRTMPLADAGLAIPLSLSVGPDNLVYILDTKPSVTVVDPDEWRVVRTWGHQGAAPGEFDLSRHDDNPGFGDIVVGSSGRVFVADGSNHRVQVLEPDGKPIAQFGRYGDGPGQFGAIAEIALDAAENIFVLDGSQNSITKLTKDGQFVWRDGPTIVAGASPGALHGLSVRPDGNVLVGCEGCQNMLVIDPTDGSVDDRFQPSFTDPVTGWFNMGGAFDDAGNLYGDTWLPGGRGADVVIAPDGDVIGTRYGTLGEIGQAAQKWGTSFYPKVALGRDGFLYTFNVEGLLQVKVTLASR